MNSTILNSLLEIVQNESVNNGGFFQFIKVPFNGVNLVSTLSECRTNPIIEIINNKNLKNYIDQKIDHWSLYSGCSPEREENTKNYNQLKLQFIDSLFLFLNQKEFELLYKIENLDHWLDKIYSTGTDHLNEDFLFQTKNEYFLLHLGFSS